MREFSKNKPENIADLIRDRLDSRSLSLLERAGHLAADRGWKAYAVGGMVRDILLNRSNFDLDILVEEHGLEFAKLWARREKGAFKLYRRFATAMVIIRGTKIDITTTRSESYSQPGALPDVVPGSLKEDLYRRDFTINAMAFSLLPEDFGSLVDICGGWEDLRSGRIRVLHERSFRDDPTRIFRAVRFQQRLGFKVDACTEDLIRNAVSQEMFEQVSPERLRRELELIFKEPGSARAIAAMARYDELRFIHPSLKLEASQPDFLKLLEEEITWFQGQFPREEITPWRIFFGALTWNLNKNDFTFAARKFNLAVKFVRALEVARKKQEIILQLTADADTPPSCLAKELGGVTPETILILAARAPGDFQRHVLHRYLTEFRNIRPSLSGNDLISLGVAPGPELGRIQERLRAGLLDSEILDRAGEITLVRKLIDR